jgi:hypothetical protein
MGPPNNTGGHRCLLCRTLVVFLGDEPESPYIFSYGSPALPTIQSLDSLARPPTELLRF